MTANLGECLPANLRGPATTINRIAAGLSGASGHRVEASGHRTCSRSRRRARTRPTGGRALHIQRLAADAGLAPRIVHANEARLARRSLHARSGAEKRPSSSGMPGRVVRPYPCGTPC